MDMRLAIKFRVKPFSIGTRKKSGRAQRGFAKQSADRLVGCGAKPCGF